ncbi:stage II sporulation protein D [Heliophilum fasciatum]|uniref:Stage II sporulation protein D n=1 Tax=Heliophilum fasciatum TaxID=35700 RepID=A0A4R2RMQ9_9FIRM|nr:stage II sporulation protein D [Heliophilum fasciatum]
MIATVLGLFFLFRLSTAEALSTSVRVLLDEANQVEVRVVSGTYRWSDEARVTTNAGDGTIWKGILRGKTITVTGPQTVPAATGTLTLEAVGTGEHIFEVNGKKYRGDLRLVPLLDKSTPTMAMINVVDVEQYLAGVVGMEMGYSAPPEALKAQAVASRSYVLYQCARRTSYRYDVSNTTLSQVYRGVEAEQPQIIAAVQQTRGQVLTMDGQVIEALFHSNAGGRTESAVNVWTNDVPYLRSVESPTDSYAEVLSAQTALAYRWNKTLSVDQLSQKARAVTGSDLGTVTAVKVTSVSPAGRVMRAELVGTKSTLTIGRSQIGAIFNTPSLYWGLPANPTGNQSATSSATWSAINSTGVAVPIAVPVTVLGAGGPVTVGATGAVIHSGGMAALNGNPAGNSTSHPTGSPLNATIHAAAGNLTITGNGYGHGVGMSQWGAMGMAKNGKTYIDILHHYYNGNSLQGRLRITGAASNPWK